MFFFFTFTLLYYTLDWVMNIYRRVFIDLPSSVSQCTSSSMVLSSTPKPLVELQSTSQDMETVINNRAMVLFYSSLNNFRLYSSAQYYYVAQLLLFIESIVCKNAELFSCQPRHAVVMAGQNRM